MEDNTSFVTVILAAGTSSRMGKQKLLLEVEGQTLLEHVVETAQASRVREVIVVLGADAEEVKAAITGYPIRTVFNPHYAAGQSSSLQVGVRALGPDVEAVLILLGDQPLVPSKLINAILARYKETGAPVVAADYDGLRAPPVLFHHSVFPELMAIEGDQGARLIIELHEDELATVPATSGSALQDVDTPQDYADLVRHLQSRKR